MRVLTEQSPALIERIQRHIDEFQAAVTVISRWGTDSLTKRVYGDSADQQEEWNGRPCPILSEVEVDSDSSRRILVAGYLLSQVRPSADWAGLTARVQNVAV